MKLLISNSYTQIKSADRSSLSKLRTFLSYEGESEDLEMDVSNTFLEEDDCTQFLTGLLPRVIEFLDSLGLSYECVDNRKYDKRYYTVDPNALTGITMHPYQVNATDKSIEDCRGIIRIGTGGGKSEVAMSLIKTLGYIQSVFVANRKRYLDQMYRRMLKRGIPEDMIGWAYEGDITELRPIMLCHIVTLHDGIHKYHPVIAKIYELTEMVIFDEAHRVKNMSGTRIMNNFKNAYRRYGLTASPFESFEEDTYGDKLIVGLFGEVITYIPASWLRSEGYLTPIEVHVRTVGKKPAGFMNNSQWHKLYKSAIVNNQDFHNMVASDAYNNLKAGRSVLILVKELLHGKNLMDTLKNLFNVQVSFFSGGNAFHQYVGDKYVSETLTEDEMSKVMEDFSTKSGYIIIGSAVYNEAIDIPSLDTVLYTAAGKSMYLGVQMPGRPSRRYEGVPDKTAVVYDYMMEWSYVLKAQCNTRIKIYESEGINVTIHK